MRRLCLAMAGAFLAWGVARADDATERERLRGERAAVEARFDAAERECATRFAVTDCNDAASAERRAALARLRSAELALDKTERQRRAAQRTAAIREKEVLQERRLAAPPAAAAPASAAASAVAPRFRLRVPEAPTGAGRPRPTPADEARHRAAYEEKLRAAEEHRQAVERRNAERAARAKKPAQPLPAQPASAVAAP